MPSVAVNNATFLVACALVSCLAVSLTAVSPALPAICRLTPCCAATPKLPLIPKEEPPLGIANKAVTMFKGSRIISPVILVIA